MGNVIHSFWGIRVKLITVIKTRHSCRILLFTIKITFFERECLVSFLHFTIWLNLWTRANSLIYFWQASSYHGVLPTLHTVIFLCRHWNSCSVLVHVSFVDGKSRDCSVPREMFLIGEKGKGLIDGLTLEMESQKIIREHSKKKKWREVEWPLRLATKMDKESTGQFKT